MAEGLLKKLDPEEVRRAAPLFEGWQDTLIWTALEGMMGSVSALKGCASTNAVIETGDFVYFGGDPNQELVAAYHTDRGDDFAIITPLREGWSELIKREYGDNTRMVTRYAIKKLGDIFDREKLRAYARALPEGVTLRRIDAELYKWCEGYDWSCDFCSLYDSAEDFEACGLGWMAMLGGEPVGGASSYIRYRDGIEIEVDTRKDMRRKGIATACCARLMLDCLECGLYPSWDAANRESVALAEKLGYKEDAPYKVWYVND